MTRPITVFYVYAQIDEELRQLEKHLTLLQRQGVLTSWQESQAGALWEQERAPKIPSFHAWSRFTALSNSTIITCN